MKAAISNQLSFFSNETPLSEQNTKPKSLVRKLKKRSAVKPILQISKTSSFFESEFNHPALELLATIMGHPDNAFILQGAVGTGKTFLCHKLNKFNPKLSWSYISAYALDKIDNFNYDELYFLDVIVLDDFTKVLLTKREKDNLNRFIIRIKDQVKIIFCSIDAAKSKQLLSPSIWHQSRVIKLQSPTPKELMEYAVFKRPEFPEELKSKVATFKNLKEVDHYLLNHEHVTALEVSNTPKPQDYQGIESSLEKLLANFNIAREEIFNRNRSEQIIIKKHFVYYWLHKKEKYSCSSIARYFELNHTTVLHAVKKVGMNPDRYQSLLTK